MMEKANSAQRLMLKLTVYFVLLFGGMFTLFLADPDILSLMPIGGTDALEIAGIAINDASLDALTGGSAPAREVTGDHGPTARQIGLVALYLAPVFGLD